MGAVLYADTINYERDFVFDQLANKRHCAALLQSHCVTADSWKGNNGRIQCA